MADLITSARAKYNLNNLTTTSAEDSTIAALVMACSRAVRRHCRRDFDSQTFDELYSGANQRALVLNQFPILSLARVAFGPTAVLQVTNASAANQRATVQVTSTGLDLTRVASGASTTTTLTFAANVTLGALAAAVAALGNGWTAALTDTSFADWASADLRTPQGAVRAKDVDALLRLHVHELEDYEVDAGPGLLYRGRSFDPEQTWAGGVHYWRVLYTAGFASVPEDVQEACAQWVAALFWQTKRDPALAQEAIPGVVSRSPGTDLPGTVRRLLAPYVNHRM